jgi:hypothetical protein
MTDKTNGIIANNRSLSKKDFVFSKRDTGEMNLPYGFAPRRFNISVPHEAPYKCTNSRDKEGSRDEYRGGNHNRLHKNFQ